MKIKALGYLFIEATSPKDWAHFLTHIVGFMPAPAMPQSDSKAFYKMDEYQWRVAIVQAKQDRLATAGWELANKEDFDQAVQDLYHAGVSFEWLDKAACAERAVREAVRFKDPAGNTLELFYYMRLDYQRLHSPANVKAFETGYHGDMGLGHFVLPTNRFNECFEFYKNVLGFAETDYMHFHFSDEANHPGQGLHFLHVNNPRHHSLAIYQDPNPPAHNCIHLMFEVKDVDEVGYFIDRCKKNDIKIVSTLGRHTNDLMLSVYVQSPGGFAIEFGCEGVQLSWENYKPTHSAVPSLWGHDWQW